MALSSLQVRSKHVNINMEVFITFTRLITTPTKLQKHFKIVSFACKSIDRKVFQNVLIIIIGSVCFTNRKPISSLVVIIRAS